MQQFRGGLVFNARRLCVSLNSRRERNKEDEENLRASVLFCFTLTAVKRIGTNKTAMFGIRTWLSGKTT